MISHSLDQRQVEQVLSQFEATTQAVRGIEMKVEKVNAYVASVQSQREELTRHAETCTVVLDGLSDTLTLRSSEVLRFCTETLDTIAGLVERLERSLYDMRLQDAPRQFQREFGPLLVPAVVLVVIVTVSNCIFGFLLASDRKLTDAFTMDIFHDTSEQDNASSKDQVNILNLFAVLHAVLIGSAALFIIVEVYRKLMSGQQRSWLRMASARLGAAESTKADAGPCEAQVEVRPEQTPGMCVDELEGHELLQELERRRRKQARLQRRAQAQEADEDSPIHSAGASLSSTSFRLEASRDDTGVASGSSSRECSRRSAGRPEQASSSPAGGRRHGPIASRQRPVKPFLQEGHFSGGTPVSSALRRLQRATGPLLDFAREFKLKKAADRERGNTEEGVSPLHGRGDKTTSISM